jgi:hypothetical protein
MRGDISHRGRKGNFLPGEKEESWKTAIREKEAAKQKQKEVATAAKTCATCAHMGYRPGKGVKCGRDKENCLGWKAIEELRADIILASGRQEAYLVENYFGGEPAGG